MRSRRWMEPPPARSSWAWGKPRASPGLGTPPYGLCRQHAFPNNLWVPDPRLRGGEAVHKHHRPLYTRTHAHESGREALLG